MASNKEITNSENILVKVDQNNLIYIDPNSVIDKDGNVQPRGVKQENLVMYVNLEADLVPRSTVVSNNGDGNTLVSIAKGNLNFLKKQTGDGNFDTSWTEAYNPSQPADGNGNLKAFEKSQFSDQSGQSFGIDSISIIVKGANLIPQVSITFVDIRGKTLFEASENSPYNAFFHLPWPIFYLTIKGYYGKAIRYRLHMTKFSSKFNESNGNFEISTTFVGSTYAYLSDIPLQAIINCPYMFLNQKSKNLSFNEKTGRYTKTISKNSRGFAILQSVYDVYKQKGLIPKDFPVKTLKEVGYLAQGLDKILEKQIFNGYVEMKVFGYVKEINEILEDFESSVNSWYEMNLSKTDYVSLTRNTTTLNNNTITEKWYYLSDKNKKSTEKILGSTTPGTLEYLITNKLDILKKVLNDISQVKLNKSTFDFRRISISVVKGINDYYKKNTDGSYVIGADTLVGDIREIKKSFFEQRSKLEDDIENQMNTVIKDKKMGLGFEPTIRNIFAVVLANAEVYIKLMKETHNKAFGFSKERAKLLKNLSKETKGDAIYPWPEVMKPKANGKENVLAYPGEPELLEKLQSYNPTLWPEIDFLENYIQIVTNKLDTNTESEPTVSDMDFVFETDVDFNNVEDLSSIDVVVPEIPYSDRSYAGFTYELYERAKYMTLFDSFDNNFFNILAQEEFKNIAEVIKEDNDLIDFVEKLKTITDLIFVTNNSSFVVDGVPQTGSTFDGYLPTLSPYERFGYFRDHIPTTPYLKNVIEQPFRFEKPNLDVRKRGDLNEIELNKSLSLYKPENYRKSIYPFNSTTYLGYLKKTSFSENDLKYNGQVNSSNGLFIVDSTQGFVVSPSEPKAWVKGGYTENIFINKISKSGTTIESSIILNTPYFHKQLYTDFLKQTKYGKYTGASYLLLNSLPFLDLEDNITFNNQTILMSSLFREISATHYVPYHLMLKWGSIYHRYKKQILEGVDILDGFLDTSYITQPLNGNLFFDNLATNTVYTSSAGAISTGTTITVSSTVGLTTGMTVTVTAGIGAFAPNTIVTSIIDNTNFIVSSTPTLALTGGLTVVTGIDDSLTKFKITPLVNNTTGSTIDVIYSGNTNVGISPVYQTIYYQIVNGYTYYDVTLGNTTYEPNTNSKKILHRKYQASNNINYWSVLVDNSQYTPTDANYTLLPSNGNLKTTSILGSDTFNLGEEKNFRTIWYGDELIKETYTGKTFSSPYEYPRSLVTGLTSNDNLFSVNTNYRKAIDLIGTFSPQILESFEAMFLDFATEKTNDEIPSTIFPDLNYSKFQDILYGLSIVKKEQGDPSNIDDLLDKLSNKQKDNCVIITSKLLSNDNLIKFTLANPKEIDPYTLYGMAKTDDKTRYTVDPFSIVDLTIPNIQYPASPTNLDLITLYIGEDIDGHYANFFSINNVKVTEENIIRYRPLVLIYAGYIKDGGINTADGFTSYLATITTNSNNRRDNFLKLLLKSLSAKDAIKRNNEVKNIKRTSGYNTSQTKLELYNTFKSFNDKWSAGNSIGQRTLLEEFLFIDKANRDIGDKLYLSLDKFEPLFDYRNSSTDLFSALGILIKDTGLDMRALPAYVNFYGTNLTNNKTKVIPSKNVAKNLFGTFLEVDYQESSPKILVQLVGQSSKRVGDMGKQYKFVDDSFYIGSVNNNPLVFTNLQSFTTNDLSKSNKVVAFEVSFGDQNQGIFKGVQLDQTTLKNTSESFIVLENLARTASGAGAYNVDVSLFDYYKQASYQCEVSCMGNVMIQPTMFFYVKNIPMFRGSYWITEVSHSIKSNTISTTFKGSRLPYSSLPDPQDSFVSSYKVLFDKLMSRAVAKLKQESTSSSGTTETFVYEGSTFTIDRGGKIIQGEPLFSNNIYKGSDTDPVVGINKFGLPYNGYGNEELIQKIQNNGTWFRTTVVKMGGDNYTIDDTTTMNIVNGIKWSNINKESDMFYSTKFQLSVMEGRSDEIVRTATTTFYNPNPNSGNKTVVLSPSYQLDASLGPIKTQGPINVGPNSTKYGMGMSKSLMKQLNLFDGDVVYFRMA